MTISIIDNVQTILTSIKGNIAKGFIVQSDLTLNPCFVVKGKDMFAHGNTLKEALKSLKEKLLQKLPTSERIKRFLKEFSDVRKKYKAMDLYDWHFFLTGSCKTGRDSFVSDKDIDLDKDKFTVSEFIELVDGNYGSDVINELKIAFNRT